MLRPRASAVSPSPRGCRNAVRTRIRGEDGIRRRRVIHFSDDNYRSGGVKIVDRREALACDIVLHLPAINRRDASMLKTGAVLLGLLHPQQQEPDALRTLLSRHVIAIALDLISDDAGHYPFADILSEVDGRAAMAMASSLLADPVHGKGILLGGVAE